MSRITDLDILELRKFFEEALSRAQKADKKQKMRLRRKIRDEVFLLQTWEKPTPKSIMSRWEERMQDVFKVLPFGFKEELFKMLIDILSLRVALGSRKKSENF
ncbi:MAG: hypothetical protein PVI82_12765 [Desulfobacterales bacterium]|jgi:hypothetical protein